MKAQGHPKVPAANAATKLFTVLRAWFFLRPGSIPDE
jgi:hypothetical protein